MLSAVIPYSFVQYTEMKMSISLTLHHSDDTSHLGSFYLIAFHYVVSHYQGQNSIMRLYMTQSPVAQGQLSLLSHETLKADFVKLDNFLSIRSRSIFLLGR